MASIKEFVKLYVSVKGTETTLQLFSRIPLDLPTEGS